MKVLRLIDTFYPSVSGPSNEVYFVSKNLEKKGIKSPVFTSTAEAENSPLSELMNGVEVKRFEYNFHFMRFYHTPNLLNAILKEKPDVIHSHNFRNYQGLIGLKAAKKLGIPFILSPCGALLGYEAYLEGLQRLPYRLFDFITRKKVAKKASKIVVKSEFEKQEALRYGIKEQNIAIIPMGIDLVEFKNQNKIFHEITSDNPLKMLFVGRISRNRNLEPIIQSLQHIDDVILRIVGGEVKCSDISKSGYINQLTKMAEELGVSEKIKFVGEIYDELLRDEYKNADIFVYTSLSENFGQTIFEAAAANLPIICTPVGIAKELIKDEITGFIVDFADSIGLSEKIEIIKDPELRKTISINLGNKMEQAYDWSNNIDKYIAIYKEFSH